MKVIFIILILTVTTSVTDQHDDDNDDEDDLLPDFYLVKRDDNHNGYRIYSKVGDCPAYQSGDRVLYQDDDLLKIAELISEDLNCQNIGTRINKAKNILKTTGELPREESDRTYSFTSTFFTSEKFTIEIETLRKCEEKPGFRILEREQRQQEPVYRAKCENRDY